MSNPLLEKLDLVLLFLIGVSTAIGAAVFVIGLSYLMYMAWDEIKDRFF